MLVALDLGVINSDVCREKQNREASVEVQSVEQRRSLLFQRMIRPFWEKLLWLQAPHLRRKTKLLHKGGSGGFGGEGDPSQPGGV